MLLHRDIKEALWADRRAVFLGHLIRKAAQGEASRVAGVVDHLS